MDREKLFCVVFLINFKWKRKQIAVFANRESILSEFQLDFQWDIKSVSN